MREGDVILCLTLAVAEGGVIGDAGRVPWRLPDDLRRFKVLTMGKPIVMGRTTFERDLKRPLPGRLNIVVTRAAGWAAEGVVAKTSIEAAIGAARAAAAASGAGEAHVIGGAQVYCAALPYAQRIYLTEVEARIPGDTVFDPPRQGWRETARERHEKDARHAHAFSFVTLERAA